MKKLVLLVGLFLLVSFAQADEFGGAEDGLVLVSECPVTIVEVEVIKYVENIEYVEIETPVYLPDGSSSIWDNSAMILYLYDVDVFEGPKKTEFTIPYAVLQYIGDADFKLITLE